MGVGGGGGASHEGLEKEMLPLISCGLWAGVDVHDGIGYTDGVGCCFARLIGYRPVSAIAVDNNTATSTLHKFDLPRS